MDFNQYVKDDALVLSKTTINISELAGFLQSNTHITKLSLLNAVSENGLARGNLTKLYIVAIVAIVAFYSKINNLRCES